MPRGRLLKTKKREARELAKAEEIGRIKGQAQAEKHMTLLQKIKEYVLPFFQNIDPLELAAVVSGAIIVHEVIFRTNEFVNSVQAWKNSSNGATILIANLGFLGFEGGLSLDLLNSLFPDLVAKVYGEKPEAETTSNSSDVIMWMMAFCISYYAFKHSGDLMAIAKTFIGNVGT